MLKAVYLFNHCNCSHPPLDAIYLFLSQKEWQCTSVMCRFHSFYYLLSLAVTHCDLLPFVVIRCQSLYHSLSFVVPLAVIRCHRLYHSLSLHVPLVFLFINDQEISWLLIEKNVPIGKKWQMVNKCF